jgi:DNA-binding transcriptional regulator LsrR (DeoR family)
VSADRDLIGRVCHFFSQGLKPAKIGRAMDDTYGVKISTQRVYDLIGEAAEKKWITVAVPQNNPASEAIWKRFRLERVDVTFTTFIDEVASRAACVLLDLIKELKVQKHNVVRIGFSGGHTMRRVFQTLTELLVVPSGALPQEVSFHALVAGFDIGAVGSDPTAFFTYLAGKDPACTTHFYLLHAPPIIPPGQLEATFELPTVKKARKNAQKLDIIVTSAAVFSHDHSQLRRYYHEHSPETLGQLEQDGCIGDMLWLPLGREGPIDTSNHPFRALTLIDLEQFPGHIDEGHKVLLVMGRCADPVKLDCNASKADVLNAILHYRRKFLTHLVLDNKTAQELMEKNALPAELPLAKGTAR